MFLRLDLNLLFVFLFISKWENSGLVGIGPIHSTITLTFLKVLDDLFFYNGPIFPIGTTDHISFFIPYWIKRPELFIGIARIKNNFKLYIFIASTICRKTR